MSSKPTQLPSGIPSEDELVALARKLLPAVDAEARPGFAQRVARRAAESGARPLGAPWWRWAFGSGALAAAAAALLVAFLPHHPAADVVAQGNPLLSRSAGELAMAQRLDLYENLTVLQNQDALEDMDVVAVLHELAPEAHP